MTHQPFKVIVFFKPGTRSPAKFNNVIDLKKCVNYCNNKLGIVYYVNLYHNKHKSFIRREWQIDFNKNKL